MSSDPLAAAFAQLTNEHYGIRPRASQPPPPRQPNQPPPPRRQLSMPQISMPQILQRKPYTAEELAQFNATREAFKAALNALNANYNNANKKKRPAYVEARKAYYQLPRNQRTIPNKFNNKEIGRAHV